MEECHILAGKIWSEEEKENSAGEYLTKEQKKEWIRERKVYLEMENLDTIQRRKGRGIFGGKTSPCANQWHCNM